jgi:SAM-dependent methyltransferase
MDGLKSNAEWKLWGKDDPLFGVASWEGGQKDGPFEWTDNDFYALGESDWRDFWPHWQNYGVSTNSCLEIGCGAGRITKQLSATFEHVYAVDVSEDMIRYARKAVGANVEFAEIDGIHLPHRDASVTAIFSTHVLQHLDCTDIGYSYFGEFFRVLSSGGTLMIHLPLYDFPRGPLNGPMRYSYGLLARLKNIRADWDRRRNKKIMAGTSYAIGPLAACLANLGFMNVEFRIFALKSNGSPHSFVFATK